MDEKEIKAGVLNYLISTKRIPRHAIVSSEYVIAGSAVRADLAILSNEFTGIEIKSNKDSLKRLPTQISGYNSYFDKVIVVLATKHFRSFKPRNYPGCEVFEIDISGSIRSHEKSPASQTVSRKPLIDLLTKAELRRFYAPHIQNTENSRSEVGSESIARSAFEDAFRAKFENSSQEFWAQIGRRKICADDLAILSRFRDQREATKRWHFDREQERQSWVIKLYELQNSQA